MNTEEADIDESSAPLYSTIRPVTIKKAEIWTLTAVRSSNFINFIICS